MYAIPAEKSTWYKMMSLSNFPVLLRKLFIGRHTGTTYAENT